MRTSYLSSLVFALLTGFSVASTAAPALASEVVVPATVQTKPADRLEAVNLNTADAEELQRELFGIGKAKAQAIVAYRESNGPFASVDELLEVKGIGKGILERNLGKLKVD